VEAMAPVVKQHPEYYLVLAGEFLVDAENLKRKFEHLIDKLGIRDHVKNLGRRDDIPQLLKQFDICVLPTENEGLPNSLLEYMAAGKPIIATDIAGNNEVIEDGRNGLLVKPADPGDLADKIIYLIEHADHAEHMGRVANRDTVHNFGIDNMIDAYERTFEELVLKDSNYQNKTVGLAR
jgi:glycosyltransferase involved in cell wall biosynthesis